MKSATIFSFFLTIGSCLHAGPGQSKTSRSEDIESKSEQVVIPGKAAKKGVTVNVTVQQNANPQTHVNQAGQVSNSNQTHVQNAVHVVSQLYNSMQARFENFLQQHNMQIQDLAPQELVNKAHSFISANPKQTALAVGVFLYGSISSYLLYGNRAIHTSENWCQWKKHLSLEELHECTQSDLQQSLREDILHRYLNRKTKDRLTSYMQFMNAVDAEEKMISRFLSVAHIVKRSRLMRLFPVNDTKIERAKERKQRLGFVKHVFISWAAQQNFEKI